MTDEGVIEKIPMEEEDPLAVLKKMINEQNAVILKQNEAIKNLTVRINESEKTNSATHVKTEPAVPEKSAQDLAWESLMKEMNLKEE